MYAFSLQSTRYGGFIFAKPCEIIKEEENLLTVSLIRNFMGKYDEDPEYQVYRSQVFEALPPDIVRMQEWVSETIHAMENVIDIKTRKPMNREVSIVDVYMDMVDRAFSTGDKVWIHSRQQWDGVLEDCIPSVVKQDQLGRSVIVDYSPNGEFYDRQLEPRKDWVSGWKK